MAGTGRPGALIPVARRAGDVLRGWGRLFIDQQLGRLAIKHPDGRVVDLEDRDFHRMRRDQHGTGVYIWDEFDVSDGKIGRLPWGVTSIGAGGTVSNVAGGAQFGPQSEFGVVRIETGIAAGSGESICLGGDPAVPDLATTGLPPVGARFVCKAWLPTVSVQIDSWSGFWSDFNTYPDAALALSITGIGFAARPGASAANWFGLTRRGTVETPVDLGITADSTPHELAWKMTSSGVDFYADGVLKGSSATNLPQASDGLSIMMGIVNKSGGVRRPIDVDYVGYVAPNMARYP
jgi:hypothetical protein